MLRYDFKCNVCGKLREDWAIPVRTKPNDGSLVWPRHCGVEMEKLPCAPAFTVNGFSAANGYSKG